MSFEADTEEEPLTSEQEAQLRQVAIDLAPAALQEMAEATTEAERFTALPRAAFAAFHLERYDQAKELAKKALELAPSYKKNWNYGNAIHAGHTVLGLTAIIDGDLPSAIKQLRESGDTPGSPQLGSFGPTMQLAKALLRLGEREAVLSYLRQCRTFWKMGNEWLDIWEDKIKSGEIPNCFMHCYRY